jgi:hypothetical protein
VSLSLELCNNCIATLARTFCKTCIPLRILPRFYRWTFKSSGPLAASFSDILLINRWIPPDNGCLSINLLFRHFRQSRCSPAKQYFHTTSLLAHNLFFATRNLQIWSFTSFVYIYIHIYIYIYIYIEVVILFSDITILNSRNLIMKRKQIT